MKPDVRVMSPSAPPFLASQPRAYLGLNHCLRAIDVPVEGPRDHVHGHDLTGIDNFHGHDLTGIDNFESPFPFIRSSKRLWVSPLLAMFMQAGGRKR